jgi:hypothetical protein
VLREDLRRAGTDHFHRHGHTRRYLGLRGVHAAFVLRPVQDRHTGKIYFSCRLKYKTNTFGNTLEISLFIAQIIGLIFLTWFAKKFLFAGFS